MVRLPAFDKGLQFGFNRFRARRQHIQHFHNFFIVHDETVETFGHMWYLWSLLGLQAIDFSAASSLVVHILTTSGTGITMCLLLEFWKKIVEESENLFYLHSMNYLFSACPLSNPFRNASYISASRYKCLLQVINRWSN